MFENDDEFKEWLKIDEKTLHKQNRICLKEEEINHKIIAIILKNDEIRKLSLKLKKIGRWSLCRMRI